MVYFSQTKAVDENNGILAASKALALHSIDLANFSLNQGMRFGDIYWETKTITYALFRLNGCLQIRTLNNSKGIIIILEVAKHSSTPIIHRLRQIPLN